MKLGWKTYEDQATFSVLLAVVAGGCSLAGVFFTLYRFNWSDFLLSYDPRGPRMFAIGGAILLALAAATTGFFMGFNSAGQRRNEKSRLSWIGFFLNAAVIALALMTAIFFVFTRNPMQSG